VQRAGAGKILFGTDGPWLHPGVELSKVYALGLSPVEKRKVLAENFLRLISHVNRYPQAGLSPNAKLAPVLPTRDDPWRAYASSLGT
jgi:uncharacterized protein